MRMRISVVNYCVHIPREGAVLSASIVIKYSFMRFTKRPQQRQGPPKHTARA